MVELLNVGGFNYIASVPLNSTGLHSALLRVVFTLFAQMNAARF